MRELGIDPHQGIVYEGTTNFGARILNRPSLIPIVFPESPEYSESEEIQGFAKVIFREDSFDPITKIRRGRVYNGRGYSQPNEWWINDPLRTDIVPEQVGHRQMQKIRLQTYQIDALADLCRHRRPRNAMLGREPFTTLWRILDIEASAQREPVLTLKSFRSFGDVPNLVEANVPAESFLKLSQYLEMVENSANRLTPNDVADRCRDALSIVFGNLCKNPKLDLAQSIEKYRNSKTNTQPNLVTHCGNVVARLHAKGKPSVQAQHNVSGLQEEHAQLSLRCLYVVLTELGWASTR